jgi:hypothetical protein
LSRHRRRNRGRRERARRWLRAEVTRRRRRRDASLFSGLPGNGGTALKQRHPPYFGSILSFTEYCPGYW